MVIATTAHKWTQKYAETDQQTSYGNYRDGAVGQKPGEYGRAW